METAYGPCSEHAAAVAIELRQRVRKPGEALHVLRDDIYEQVSVAYSDKTDNEQDAIGVEVFTNAVGDAEIVQKLLERRPRTLAQAYDIARRHETTKQAVSRVTSLMQSVAYNTPERRSRAAMVREGTEGEEAETVVATPAVSYKPKTLDFHRTSTPQKSSKDIKWEDIRCHKCSGIGHMKRNCPSPKKMTRIQAPTATHDCPEPT
eukprot:superscaffoldBa00002165_g13402